jgi:predicted aspartyl protease
MRVPLKRREAQFGRQNSSGSRGGFRSNTITGQTAAVIAVFVGLVISAAAAKHDVQKIPFILYRNHLIVVEGSLKQQQRHVLIDTGTNVSIIDTATAEELNLQHIADGNITTLDGVAQTYFAILPELALGPIHRENLRVAVNDLSWVHNQIGIRVDAVIGIDALQAANFQIDYISRTIRFGSIRMPRTAAPMVEENGLLTVQAELNGTSAKLLVDTGGSALVLFAAEMPQVTEWKDLGIPIRMSNLAGHTDLRQIQLKDAHIGDVNLSGTLALIAGNPTCCHLQGLLGISQVQFKRVVFDFTRSLVGFELQNSFIPLQTGNLADACCNAAQQPRAIRVR